MKVADAYPKRTLTAADLGNEDHVVTITGFKMENFAAQGEEPERKIELALKEMKPFVVNKTNANSIAKVLGSDDTDDWIGKQITIYATEVQFKDDMVLAIRVRLRAPKAVAKPQAPAPDPEPHDDLEIPGDDLGDEPKFATRNEAWEAHCNSMEGKPAAEIKKAWPVLIERALGKGVKDTKSVTGEQWLSVVQNSRIPF